MPRAGLTADSVVEAAAELADAEGLEALTLSRLAQRLGVRPPSLYAHVGGLQDLRERLAERGSAQLADALQAAAAGRSGAEALTAVAAAYRDYARWHRGLYAALQRPPAGGVDDGRAATRVLAVVLAVLRGYGLEGEPALHAARALRSALHGFVSLEAQGGFGLPLSLDQSFAALVALIDRGLRPPAG
ncbi:MAG: TetR/AcrR family transcriptional regulator [Solirubrobacteraceae bacterium]